MKLFFLFFFPKTTKDLQSTVYLLVQEKHMNYKKVTLFLCSFEKLWAVMLTVESRVPRLPQGQTEQWCYFCQFGSQMRSKCPVKEKRHSVYTRWDWIFMLIKVTMKGFPIPFKCKGADERLNMNYMSASDLYPQELSPTERLANVKSHIDSWLVDTHLQDVYLRDAVTKRNCIEIQMIVN